MELSEHQRNEMERQMQLKGIGTYQELSGISGVSVPAISRLMTGKPTSRATFVRVASALKNAKTKVDPKLL